MVLPRQAVSLRQPDPEQDAVVQAGPEARLIVESAPGCGKTDVACARVAHLAGIGVPAARIVLLSFTRTAVREIRKRVAELASQGTDVNEADVRTIDSFAWQLRTGPQDETRRSFGSYEESIREATRLIASGDQAVREYIQALRHVIVDEAQDLVGDRATFVRTLLKALGPGTGWTVFLDPAQAIYEWSESGESGASGESFVEGLEKLAAATHARQLPLHTLHRTSNADLRRLMKSARDAVLGNGANAVTAVRKVAFRHGKVPSQALTPDSFAQVAREADESTLFLFRTRVEAFEAARWLTQAGLPHRLRFGGLPWCVPAWIGAVAGTADTFELSEAQFERAWQKATETSSALLRDWNGEAAWSVLRRLGMDRASKKVSLGKVADRIARRLLPDELTSRELGIGGPVVGTIHGSKGREAETVYACLIDEDDDSGHEEARVVYVALTRARSRCVVQRSKGFAFQMTKSGRVWRYDDKGFQIRLECGREGDVDILGAVLASGDPGGQQNALLRWDGAPTELRAVKVKDGGLEGRAWRHVLAPFKGKEVRTDKALGSFSQLWTDDVHKNLFRTIQWKSTPYSIYDLRMVDVTTVAVTSDAVLPSSLPEPWRTRRLWLAPIVASWGRAYKPRSKK